MVLLFRLKKKLLTKSALKAEKKKLIKEAQAKIESNELTQLQALRTRISKAKNINIPKNLEVEIKRRKATKRRLTLEAGKGLRVGLSSLKVIGKQLSNLDKLSSRPINKVVKRRISKKRTIKKAIKKRIKKNIRRKR